MTPQGPADDWRDESVERAWRAASNEQPSARTDAAILTAATQEVAPRRWTARWLPLAAAAGVAGLSFLVVQQVPRESVRTPAQAEAPAAPQMDARSAAPSEAPSPAPVEAMPEATVRAPAVVPATAAPVAPTQAAGSASALAETPPAAPAPAPSPSTTTSRELSSAEADLASPSGNFARESASKAAVAGAAAPSDDMAQPDVSRLVALFDAGDVEAAARELRALRAIDPKVDERLPARLRDWAEGLR